MSRIDGVTPRASACVFFLFLMAASAAVGLDLGPEELVEAGGSAIAVPGYSVPSFVFWDGDFLPDLVVGQGGGTVTFGKVRVYLNEGTASAPQFSNFAYAQSLGSDLSVPASGCLGAFPRLTYWDADARKDLVVGLADGTVKLFLNVATDEAPAFDGGTALQVGAPGVKTDIDIGSRATPTVLDWNSDGMKDLVIGGLDGKVYVYLNEGSDAVPDFRSVQAIQQRGADLVVPSGRASPHAEDVNDDDRKDLLLGNTSGQLLLYLNTGTDESPVFTDSVYVEADGVAIDLLASRSRPSACDWTGDGWQDVLIGASDGLVYLFQGVDDLTGFGPVDRFVGAEEAGLLIAYPNPVRQGTRLTYVLPAAGPARVTVHDSRGRHVTTLSEGARSVGEHVLEWGARDSAGRPVAAGVYFVRLETLGRTEVRKLVVIR